MEELKYYVSTIYVNCKVMWKEGTSDIERYRCNFDECEEILVYPHDGVATGRKTFEMGQEDELTDYVSSKVEPTMFGRNKSLFPEANLNNALIYDNDDGDMLAYIIFNADRYQIHSGVWTYWKGSSMPGGLKVDFTGMGSGLIAISTKRFITADDIMAKIDPIKLFKYTEGSNWEILNGDKDPDAAIVKYTTDGHNVVDSYAFNRDNYRKKGN